MRGFRLGSAFILLGVIILIVFTLSLSIGQGDPLTLVIGASLSALGLLLRRRNARAAREASYPITDKALEAEEDE